MENIGEYQYSKKDLIGHGAFAVVFKGQLRKDPEQKVAIKCITKKNLAKSAALLSKEIKILKELSYLKHENVVGLMDCKETSHHVFLIMEYCNGGDLADYLQAKGTLSEDTICLFLRQIAESIKALVAKGVVHRDLKPQNILLCHSGEANPPPHTIRLKIADFGFARFLQDGVMAATLCGSPMYMAPEVIMSLQYCAKADLWSVGTIVYQCLTGKAPFQAQTPQQLKQFYERNANLAPRIPEGTSPELKNLLIRLLKRNAKDRIEFTEFFSHPFMQPKAKSDPVAVPSRSRSKSSISDSPVLQPLSASPLSCNMSTTPPPPLPVKPSAGRVVNPPREVLRKPPLPEPMDESSGVTSQTEQPMEQEGFVLVPDDLPDSGGSSKREDLGAIFSDVSTKKPSSSPIAMPGRRTSGNGGGNRSPARQPSSDNLSGSPNRPSSLPVEVPVSSRPSSEPIPVPTQRKNYQLIQESIGQSPSPGTYSPASPRRFTGGSSGGSTGRDTQQPQTGSSAPVSASGRRQSASPTPPLFHLGTPPQNSGMSAPSNGNNTPHYANVQMMQAGGQNSPRRATLSGALTKVHTSPQNLTAGLPAISGTNGRTTFTQLSPTAEEADTARMFARTRTQTCPDNIGAVGYNFRGNDRFSGRPLSADMGEAGALSKQLVCTNRHPFIPSPPTSGLAAHLTAQSPPPGGIFSLATSPPPGGMFNMHPFGGSSGSLQRAGSNTSLTRVRRYSTTEPPGSGAESGGSMGTVAESSPRIEGPVSFIAPDLAEETLMDSTHNDTVNKINFVIALVECIIEIANVKSSILSESIIGKNFENIVLDKELNNAGGSPMDTIPVDENRVHELMLMIRALQLLGATIQMAREEIMKKRLHPSAVVKTILTEMTQHYHKCLCRCKELQKLGVLEHKNLNSAEISNTADRIIYSYAIEMCQTAALGELFGNPQECFHHYRNAHILLHSLAEKADDETDRQLLNKYRESVEQRITNMYKKGLIDTLNAHRHSSTSS